jgi:hypothetical protein
VLAEVIADVEKVALLHELLRHSLELWRVDGDVGRAGNIITVSAGTSVVVVRHDPGNAVALWWIAKQSGSVDASVREKPCNSSLATLASLRRILAVHGDQREEISEQAG